MPRFTRSQIESFLPPGGAKGAFQFPAPYNTDAIRLTNASDCVGGQDCLWYVGYSYWRNINNHAGSADMYVFLGTDRNRGGVGPILLRYNKVTDEVRTLGPLFPADSLYSFASGEGWYFSARQPTRLYTFLAGGTQLRRYDVLAKQFEEPAALDVNECRRRNICPPDAAYLWQPHSSDDDLVHSATVQNSAFHRLRCVVFRVQRPLYFAPPPGNWLDECHVDK